MGLLIGVIVGIALTFLAERYGELIPSSAAMGIGMLIPADVLSLFILGGFAQWIWAKTSAAQEEKFRIPLASGFIAGEAIIAVLLSILAWIGISF